MKKFKKVFKSNKSIIGMIHVDALPGTPKYKGSVKNIIDKALMEAKFYKSGGVDAIAIENMHDVPYLNKSAGPEITSLMSIIGYEIKQSTKLPVGVQILAGANKQALAAANSAGLDFIRAEGFVFAHVADEGTINSDAGELLRYRRSIGAENILILTDIKKKHSSHNITEDVSTEQTAAAAEFFLSDGIILTGSETGKETDLNGVQSVKKSIKLPVIIGSGITVNNIANYLPYCDAFIVGSHFKKSGNWKNTVDTERVKVFMKKINQLR